jgi:hypothetical protein
MDRKELSQNLAHELQSIWVFIWLVLGPKFMIERHIYKIIFEPDQVESVNYGHSWFINFKLDSWNGSITKVHSFL